MVEVTFWGTCDWADIRLLRVLQEGFLTGRLGGRLCEVAIPDTLYDDWNDYPLINTSHIIIEVENDPETKTTFLFKQEVFT